jgi:hypothetical protein
VSTTIAYLPTLDDEFVTDYVEFCAGRRGVDPEEALKFLNAQDWAGARPVELSPAEKAAHEAGMKEFTRQLKKLDHEPTVREIQMLLTSAIAPAVRRTQLHIVPQRIVGLPI